MSQERLVRKSSIIKHVGTHGSKMNGKSDLPVAEQGEELFFYQSHRNEPVPPDPSIISAVKHTPAVAPRYTRNIPKHIEPGKPIVLAKGKNHVVGVNRQDNSIPSYDLFAPKKSAHEKLQLPLNVTEKDINEVSPELNPLGQVQKQLSNLEMSSPESQCGWASLHNNLYQYPSTDAMSKKGRSKGCESDRKGPKVFVFPDDKPPLIDVKISSAISADDFMIMSVDPKKQDELEILQNKMYSWCTSDEGKQYLNNFSDNSFCQRGYYGLLIRQQNTCVRVQLLNSIDESDDAYVFCIDYGTEEKVSRNLLVPMKPEWKILEQLTCHAEIEGSGGDEALRNFKDKYEYKTICIELRGMMPKKRIYNGISMRVKCCRVCFYDEQAEVNSVDGF